MVLTHKHTDHSGIHRWLDMVHHSVFPKCAGYWMELKGVLSIHHDMSTHRSPVYGFSVTDMVHLYYLQMS